MGSKVLEGGGVRLGRGWLRKRRRGCNYLVPFCSCDANREEGRGEVYGRCLRSGERGRVETVGGRVQRAGHLCRSTPANE